MGKCQRKWVAWKDAKENGQHGEMPEENPWATWRDARENGQYGEMPKKIGNMERCHCNCT